VYAGGRWHYRFGHNVFFSASASLGFLLVSFAFLFFFGLFDLAVVLLLVS